MYYAVFINFSVIWRCFLGKLPVLLVNLSWHQPVSCNANPATLSAKNGSQYYHLWSLWYDQSLDLTHDLLHPRIYVKKTILIDRLRFNAIFNNLLSHITTGRSPTNKFTGFPKPVLRTTHFPSNWLLFYIYCWPIDRRRMILVIVTFTGKECWPSWDVFHNPWIDSQCLCRLSNRGSANQLYVLYIQ